MNYFNHFSEPDNVNLIQIHLKKNVKDLMPFDKNNSKLREVISKILKEY
jgi:hypothetical protein|tara:strand:+ start:57 stop:203 length:147 start_codon:yes stop_codon:yes gene_type:complete